MSAGEKRSRSTPRWIVRTRSGSSDSRSTSVSRACSEIATTIRDLRTLARASALAAEADVLLCVGSSLEVWPVAELPQMPRGKGNKMFGLSSKKVASREEYLAAMAVIAPGIVAMPFSICAQT
jgi:hypothetical protein